MKVSPLAPQHERLGARMVPFAGWEMPIQYTGIVAEHEAVRSSLGIFDISHMALVEVRGPAALSWLNQLLTNDLASLGDGEGQYTLMLNERAGVIDDLISYRVTENRLFLVLNASRESDDWDWLNSRKPGEGVDLENLSDRYGAVAVQGPNAEKAWNRVFPGTELPARNGIRILDGDELVCRTGYTGEDGFELFAPVARMGEIFEAFMEAGATTCGLGSRDTLRLEKGYPLYGNDLDEEHTPLEAGLGFFVKLEKEGGFTGVDVLRDQKQKGLNRKLCALRAEGKTPPFRPGYPVFDGDKEIGSLSSGGLSPGLGTSIGMAYLPVENTKNGSKLSVSVREKLFPAEVVRKPFI